jgi:MFS family permease
MAREEATIGTDGLSGALDDGRHLRRVVRLVCAIVFVDTIFFAIVAPLLPSLVHEFHLSKLSAGILTGALAAGNVLGSIPGGLFAARAGARQATVVGLTLLAATSVAFGLGTNIAVLDLARFLSGVAEAFTWAGAFTWVVAEAPVERRGSLIGQTVAAAGAGSLFGPVIGTIAHALGREAVFAAFAAIPLAFAVITRVYGSSSGAPVISIRTMASVLKDRVILVGAWLVLLGGAAQALVSVLGPLRMAALGGGATAIGAAFLVSAGLESPASLLSGRMSDRHGPSLPMIAGLACGTVFLPLIAIVGTEALLGAVLVLIGGSVGLMWPSAFAAISDAAESSAVPQGLAFALGNMTWGIGAMVGAAAGGGIAKAAGDGVALALMAASWALTAVALAIRRRSGGRSL